VRVEFALLTEAAKVQEDGLLYVLGGCVTVVEREEFPARLNLDLAFRLVVTPDEEGSHQMLVRVAHEDDRPVADLRVSFEAENFAHELLREGDTFAGTIALPLRNVTVPEPGRYLVEIREGDELLGRVGFIAALPAE